MDYPFNPLDLVPPGSVNEPPVTSYDGFKAVREMQAQLVQEDPFTFAGARTAYLPMSAYAYEEGIGSIHFRNDTFQMLGEENAVVFVDVLGSFPHQPTLKPDPDAYWFVGELFPDPDTTTSPVNHAAMEWFKDFFRLLKQYDYTFINSVAYEILDFFMPDAWKQKNYLGNPAQSGWVPPSCFIRPTSPQALHYIAQVQIQVIQAAIDAGVPVKFQIGEPWWWDGSYSVGGGQYAPCIYDDRTRTQYLLETGNPVPTPWIENIFEPLTPENRVYAEWLRDKLGESTNAIRDMVREHFLAQPDGEYIEATLLFFTPQIMSPASDLTNIMNFPTDHWKIPNYDFVQIEDYDWVIAGRLDLVPLTFDAAENKLGYPRSVVHYFAGFILNAWDYHIWPWIDKAIRMAKDANMPYIYVWSYTQAMRDSIVYGDALPVAMEVPIFDMPPNWSGTYQITREYNTEVQQSRALMEVRRAGRSVPRKSLQFTSLFSGRERRQFDAFLATWQGFRFYMPEYTRWVETETALEADEISVELSRIPPWIQLGTVVLLAANDELSARVVDRLIPEENRIEFLAPDGEGKSWPAGTRIHPALYGMLADNISTSKYNERLSENMILFNVVPGSEPATRDLAEPAVVFDGVEVWTREPNWASSPTVNISTGVEHVDYGVGSIQPFNFAAYTQRVTRFSYYNTTVDEVDQMHAFFERMRGQQGVFWCPTWEEDLVATADNVPGDVLRVEGDEIATYLANDGVLRNLMILDNEEGMHFFKIVSVAAAGENTDIEVTPPLTAGLLARISKISWLVLSRLSTDSITESWTSESLASFDLNIKSLPASEK